MGLFLRVCFVGFFRLFYLGFFLLGFGVLFCGCGIFGFLAWCFFKVTEQGREGMCHPGHGLSMSV